MGFSGIYAYSQFAQRIRRENRFGTDAETQDFLKEFRKQVKSRDKTVSKGTVLYRAIKEYFEEKDDESGEANGYISGCDKERVFPKEQYAFEGRVNSKGVVCLYVATSAQTAVSECRPTLHQILTVAQIETVRELRIADMGESHGKNDRGGLSFQQQISGKGISQKKIDKCVWNDIDNAFSTPVTRSETSAEYAPTQILAEVLKILGFDGVAYKSSFGADDEYNVALFNLADTTLGPRNTVQVTQVSVEFEGCSNLWDAK